MADVTRNKRDGTLKAVDASVTPVSTTINFAEGDFTYNDPEKAEPIAIKNRQGALDHLKKNDEFNGFGVVSFGFKYVDNNIKDALCNPATTTAVDADGVPASYACVNIEYKILDQDESTEVETHYLYNVWFDPAKTVFSEGDEYSSMSAEGVVFGKVVSGERVFSEVKLSTT